jgi:dihydrofolate synthase/folylpolyglutamate synthase
MMNTREPADFLEPFRALAPRVLALTIPGEPNAHKAAYIASEARRAGFEAKACRGVETALAEAANGAARVVICGSLYLGGHVLLKNGTPPS